jgi:hypothetical protein
VHGIELVLEKNLPVVVLNDAEAAVDDLDVAVRGPVAHVVECPAAFAQPFVEIWSGCRKVRKNKAAIGADAGRALHVGGLIALTQPRLVVTVRRG